MRPVHANQVSFLARGPERVLVCINDSLPIGISLLALRVIDEGPAFPGQRDIEQECQTAGRTQRGELLHQVPRPKVGVLVPDPGVVVSVSLAAFRMDDDNVRTRRRHLVQDLLRVEFLKEMGHPRHALIQRVRELEVQQEDARGFPEPVASPPPAAGRLRRERASHGGAGGEKRSSVNHDSSCLK